MRNLPSGTVTFLFTDIDGSTKLLDELGEEGYETALAEHREKLRAAFRGHRGVEVDTQGDAFFYAFARPDDAVAAAADGQRALELGPIRVRMGLHTGQARLGEEGYVGREVHRGARVAALGHGGQVLLSHTTRVVVSAELVELGEHRLKDFAQPVPIYQLGNRHFPPLKSISNTNLPRPASSFVGREGDVDAVVRLLRGRERLVTLTGPGGSGKTRLAIEAAAELVAEFKAGVFWVGLAPLAEPTLVVEAIAQTLGAQEPLTEHITDRELLLLLDNLEQVIDAAPELALLVETCPNLSLLITSRERLRVRGEMEYPVLPLGEDEAVRLFCERAAVAPDRVVAELCRALDHLPLAVELAAARVSVLDPKAILDRVETRLDLLRGGRDADPRQQTLRTTIAWSHDLLRPEERRLFRHLSVFVGGCTFAAAEEVAGADLETLQSLIDKSLVRRTADRFWMLETIREYARECLAASGEADTLLRGYANFYSGIARRLQPELRNVNPEAIAEVEAEHDNMRAVLRWSLESSIFEYALELVWHLKHFWLVRAYGAEGDEWARRILAATSHLGARQRVWCVAGAADLALVVGDAERAKELKIESIDGLRELKEHDLVAGTFSDLACLEADRHSIADARMFEAEAKRTAALYTTPRAQAFAIFAEAYCELRERRFDEAAESFRRAEAAWEAVDSAGDVANCRLMAGECLRRAGSLVDASRCLREAIRHLTELGETMVIPEVLQEVAGLALALGASHEAAVFLAASVRARSELGQQLWDAADYERIEDGAHDALDAQSWDEAWATGIEVGPEDAVGEALNYLDLLASAG